LKINEIQCPVCDYTLEEYLSQNDDLEFSPEDEATDEEVDDFWHDHFMASLDCVRDFDPDTVEF